MGTMRVNTGLIVVMLLSSVTMHSRLVAAAGSNAGVEARAEAAEVVGKVAQSNCGPDTFSKRSGLHFGEIDISYWQYKGFSWKLKEDPLTEADRLNGIQWHGTLDIKARVYREYSRAFGDSESWSAWRNFSGVKIQFVLTKAHGQWDVVPEDSLEPVGNEAPSCDELKAILPKEELGSKSVRPKGEH
jgi:hypothetical protein